MNEVNRTLYIPLYGKAFVTRKGLFIDDPSAAAIWEKEGFPLSRRARSKYLAYYMGIRAAVFDEWLRTQLTRLPGAAIIHIGCGMDARVQRVPCDAPWYDVDFPDVIRERKRHFPETDRCRMLGCDVRGGEWLAQIAGCRDAIVVMEGVSMYLTAGELRGLMEALNARFDRIALLMDCYSTFAAKMSKYKNPVHTVGVTQVYGMDAPETLGAGGLRFAGERDMTPPHMTGQLRGAEKILFRKLYAGRMSKKLYRLYEFAKN